MNYISALPSKLWEENTKHLCILGSTGSIGKSTLNVIRKNKEYIDIIALAGGKNIALLAEQAIELRPRILAIQDEKDKDLLYKLLKNSYTPTIVYGKEGYRLVASLSEVDTVLSAQVGSSGLLGTYTAIEHGKIVALANKESLVLAGSLLRRIAKKSGSCILPVDSEHSAIFQAIQGRPRESVSRLILTASGGSLRGKTKEELEHVTINDALQHPTWKMGSKITIDSATMMNKGLEIIEAYHLFGMPLSSLSAVIHPQSIIHSFVEFTDATQLAQCSYPSMELAISYALFYPYSRSVGIPSLSLSDIAQLTFESIEPIYRCYFLALEALEEGDEATIILNGANEIAVEAFLSGTITFNAIAEIVEYVLKTIDRTEKYSTIEEILAIDTITKEYTKTYIQERYTKKLDRSNSKGSKRRSLMYE